MKRSKTVLTFICALLCWNSIHTIEWKRPDIPHDEAARYKLETDRAQIHDEITKAEQEESEGKEIDETDLALKKKQEAYIDTTLSLFDEEHAAAPDQSKIENDKQKLDEINKEITQLEEQSQTGFNPSNENKKPNFLEKIYLHAKRFLQERQLQRAIAQQTDVAHIGKLQASLSTIYDKLNDIKSKQQLQNFPVNYQPQAVIDHLKRFEKALSDPDRANKTAIENYLDHYLKKIIKSGLEFDFENRNDQEAIMNYHNEITAILESLGIDEEIQKQITASITETVKNITPENITTTITNFFDNKGDMTFNQYTQLKQEVAQGHVDYSPSINEKLQKLEKTLQALYHLSNFSEGINEEKRKQLLTFLLSEYNDLSKIYENYTDTENSIKARARATTIRARLERAIKDQSQKYEPTVAFKQEVEKNKNAKPISPEAKKLSKNLKQTVDQVISSLTFGIDNAQISFKNVIQTIDNYTNAKQSADPSREGLDSDQTVIDTIKLLIDELYDYTEFTALSETQKNSIADWITQLINKTFLLDQQKAQEFKDLLRELPNGALIELPQSVKNPNNEPTSEGNKDVFNALKKDAATINYKSLFNQVVKELTEKTK